MSVSESPLIDMLTQLLGPQFVSYDKGKTDIQRLRGSRSRFRPEFGTVGPAHQDSLSLSSDISAAMSQPEVGT